MADLYAAVRKVLASKGYSGDVDSDIRAALEVRLGVLTRRAIGRIFQCGSVIIGISLGFLTGEWKGASKKSKDWLLRGLVVLVLGGVIASCGTGLIQKEKEKEQKKSAAMPPAAKVLPALVSS